MECNDEVFREVCPEVCPVFELLEPQTVVTHLVMRQLQDIRTFFARPMGATQLREFISEPIVSGRLLDFLVTTYSQLHLCSVGESDVRALYEQALDRAKGRANFDPFNRQAHGIPIVVRLGSEVLRSAVAQLNFIRWYYMHGIDEFVTAHHASIASEMKRTYKLVNAEKRNMARAGQKRKRKALIERPCGALLSSGTFVVSLM